MIESVLNYAPHHERLWGSGGMAQYILNLDTRLTEVVNVMPQPLSTGIHYVRGSVCLGAILEIAGKRKVSYLCQ